MVDRAIGSVRHALDARQSGLVNSANFYTVDAHYVILDHEFVHSCLVAGKVSAL